MSNSAPTPANQADPILAEHADAIWALGKRAVGDVIEIGRRPRATAIGWAKGAEVGLASTPLTG